ncbi:MAG: RNA 2',3'-cyclic phosphodiesterase [Lentisphaeria bacterium]
MNAWEPQPATTDAAPAPAGAATARLFVAIPLPETVRAALALAIGRLHRAGGRIGWVAPENLHVTLAFLGDLPEERLPAAAAALDQAAAGHQPFPLTAAGLGTFGHPRAPRVIWAGLAGDLPRLLRLQAAVAAAFQPLGFAEDRPFHPHLTLGRVRGGGLPTAFFAELAKRGHDHFGDFTADRLELIRSQLRPAGPHYELLHAAPLTP